MYHALQQRVQGVSVPVQVRSCHPGEVVGSQGNVCDPCPAGQYSFNTTSTACHDACPDHADCPQGVLLVPAQGFWHSVANATLIHACPNQAACRLGCLNAFLHAACTAQSVLHAVCCCGPGSPGQTGKLFEQMVASDHLYLNVVSCALQGPMM